MEPEGPSPGATWDASQTATCHLGQSSGAEQEVTFPDTPPQAPGVGTKATDCASQASRELTVATDLKLSEWLGYFLLF